MLWTLVCTFITLTALAAPADAATAQVRVLVETEGFEELGGWVVDQQFMDLMGSPYLLAHGLGTPVRDATTSVKFTAPGKYRVWVRTRDWVAPWKAPGAPGRFQLFIDGEPLETLFGTEGAEWHWQDGGVIEVGQEARLALHDLTGFEGRADAVLFSADLQATPPNDLDQLAELRRDLLGLPSEPDDGGDFDLVVIGGGVAGTSAAVSAARLGLSVALVQDRPVLGGNSSSEVRVWPEGATKVEPYPHIGELVLELVGPATPRAGNAKNAVAYNDQRKLAVVQAEPNITLLLEHRANKVIEEGGRVRAIIAQHTRSGRRVRLDGKLFADCTGDGVIGYLAGADYEITHAGHMGASNLWNLTTQEATEPGIECECEDKEPVSMAFAEGAEPAPFPRCPWAIDLSEQPFPGRKNWRGQWGAKNPLSNLGGWFWESGFDKDPIEDMEYVRDLNLRAMYGAWDALKNVDGLYPTYRLNWAAFVAGKRESRRLMGDVVLTADDLRTARKFPDACFPCTWHIDLHHPAPGFDEAHGDDAFISQATDGGDYRYEGPYWAPYRCLYSRNVDNLFMAGRDISVTHEALGAVRVMRTTGCMGEVLGMAASICVSRDCSPREVYSEHLEELTSLLRKGVGVTAAEPAPDKAL